MQLERSARSSKNLVSRGIKRNMTPFVARRWKSKNYLTAGEEGASDGDVSVVSLIWILSVSILVIGIVQPSEGHIKRVPDPSEPRESGNASFVPVAKKTKADNWGGCQRFLALGPALFSLTVGKIESQPVISIQCDGSFLPLSGFNGKRTKRVFPVVVRNTHQQAFNRSNNGSGNCEIGFDYRCPASAHICNYTANLPLSIIQRLDDKRDMLTFKRWSLAGDEGISGNSYRQVSENCLVHNPEQSGDKRPCRNPLRPCYEFVPRLRLILAITCLACTVAINSYGHRWIRLLCIFPFLCTGWLILCGHKYWCQDDNREYEYDPRFHAESLHSFHIISPGDGFDRKRSSHA